MTANHDGHDVVFQRNYYNEHGAAFAYHWCINCQRHVITPLAEE